MREEFDHANRFELGTRDVAATVLVLPGWQNSGPRHWQTLWEQQNPIFLRVQQRDWEYPHRDWWLERITAEVKQSPPPIVFAAHSLGCIALAHWCKASPSEVHKIKGALLVAPADVDSKDAPKQLKDFSPVPRDLLPFPSIVVASSTRSVSHDRARPGICAFLGQPLCRYWRCRAYQWRIRSGRLAGREAAVKAFD